MNWRRFDATWLETYQLARLAEPVLEMRSEDALDHGEEAELSVWDDSASDTASPEISYLPLPQLLQRPSDPLNKKDLARCDTVHHY